MSNSPQHHIPRGLIVAIVFAATAIILAVIASQHR